jgi:hypothetical protein
MNSAHTKAFNFASVVENIPNILKVVQAASGLAQLGIGIAASVNPNLPGLAQANAAFGMVGSLAGSVGLNSAGDTLVLTDNQYNELNAAKQNFSTAEPIVNDSTDYNQQHAFKIKLPALNKMTMITLPMITEGKRRGQKNELLVKVEKVGTSRKTALKSIPVAIENEQGEVKISSRTEDNNYVITFYVISEPGKGYELSSIFVPKQPKELVGFVTKDGQLQILGTAQGKTVISAVPSDVPGAELAAATRKA